MRKFCWGTFLGMAVTAAFYNYGLLELRDGAGHLDAIIASGLLFGCLTVVIFGSARARGEQP